MPANLNKHWHHLPIEEIEDLIDSDTSKGLDIFEIQDRIARFGRNEIKGKKTKSPLVRFLSQFHQPLVYILLSASFITAFLHEWIDAGVIFLVVLINAIIGFVQEAKALSAIEALAKIMSSEAVVLRSGEKQTIPAQELVPGDIVYLKSGDKVPADLRLFKCRELQVDESSLTGESIPVQKNTSIAAHDATLAERKNMAYSSTYATYGTAMGIVVATGVNTEIGLISRLIEQAEVLATPLTRRINQFSHILLYVILALAGLTFLVGTYRGEPWFDMFMASVALAVGAIPEGLPAAITITLAIGVSRMAKQNAIIRHLPAVETLGSTTVICSDKTGTLTQNQMTVQEIYAGNEKYLFSGSGYDPEGAIMSDSGSLNYKDNQSLLECLKAGVLCNDSRLIHKESKWCIEGDPTEGALIVSAEKAGIHYDHIHKEYSRIDSIPFESQHNYMAVLNKSDKEESDSVVFIKGSVESVLPRCDSMLDPDGSKKSIKPELIHRQMESMAEKGLRVLAFAVIFNPKNKLTVNHPDVQESLTFVGLQGMIDPPRPEAVQAIKACHQAGIRVKMITGDHAVTAKSIAKKMNLDMSGNTSDQTLVLTGMELNKIKDSDLIDAVEKTAVFARVTPEQKLKLVKALQSRGHIVAMTGDGVNDAPALRKADIGVAMGRSGTEVAKEASDMILTDDNFASIQAAVEEGRGVLDNLIKFIVWTMPTNISEGLVILAAVFTGSALPVLPIQILWINMTTAIFLGLTLAFEPKEQGIMMRPPRDPKSPILNRFLIFRIALVSSILLIGAFGLFYWELSKGVSVEQARTVAVNVIVVGESFYLLSCRSLNQSMFALGIFSNKYLIAGLFSMLCLQVIYTHTPLFHTLFQSAHMSALQWVEIVMVGVIVFCVVGLEKRIRRNIFKRA